MTQLERLRVPTVPHQVALARIRSLFADRFLDQFDAIVTHWLADPSRPPPLMPEGTERRWRIALADGDVTTDPGRVKIDYGSTPFPPPSGARFLFSDLFAGIGGFRLALQSLGGRSVFSCEWDRYAQQTYFSNFGEVPFGDIRYFTANESDDALTAAIPAHDILCAGFPCQPFSKAGVSARRSLGLDDGFACRVQGTLFFDIVRVAKAVKPRVLFLENVRNLQSHDNGRTFSTIREVIEDELGYSFASAVIDSSALVPQRRQRCYMVCFRDPSDAARFAFPMKTFAGDPLALRTVLERNVSEEFTISDRLWTGHQNRTRRNLARGTGFTAFTANLDRPANTLVARYGKDGKECLVPQPDRNPRMLTPRECARLQGYPDTFRIDVPKTQAYKQFGNSVAVPVVVEIAKSILSALASSHSRKDRQDSAASSALGAA